MALRGRPRWARRVALPVSLSLLLARGFNMTPPVHSEVFSSIVDVLPRGAFSGQLPPLRCLFPGCRAHCPYLLLSFLYGGVFALRGCPRWAQRVASTDSLLVVRRCRSCTRSPWLCSVERRRPCARSVVVVSPRCSSCTLGLLVVPPALRCSPCNRQLLRWESVCGVFALRGCPLWVQRVASTGSWWCVRCRPCSRRW
jgi:hypothetical protein